MLPVFLLPLLALAQEAAPLPVRREILMDAGVALTEVGLQYIQNRTETILAAKGVPKKSFHLLLFPELSEATLMARDVQTATWVEGTLRSVLQHYLTAVRSRTFHLQYGDASKVQQLLLEIYRDHPPKHRTKVGLSVPLTVDISKDERSNSIVATGPLNILNQIYRTIQSLDHRTTQVLIRVLIAEVTLDDDTQYGVEWSLGDGSIFGGKGTSRFDLDFGSLSPANQGALQGFKYSVLRAGKLRSFLRLLETRSQIHVLSAPQLLTSNNSRAYFEETVKVPILKTVATANGVVSTSVDYSDIGIKLTVTPRINADDFIEMRVEQTIQNILPRPLVQNAPTFSNRVVRTGVMAKNGHTVVIGGLLKNNQQTSLSKVPLLGDLPGIKHFFRKRTRSTEKTELMVFLTPQVVEEAKTMQEVVKELPAPGLKARLRKASSSFLAAPHPGAKKTEIVVLRSEGDQVILSVGADAKVAPGDILEIYRKGRKYLHPRTNQLIRVEDREIARIQIKDFRGATATALVLSRVGSAVVRVGDKLRRPTGSYGFTNLEVTSLDVVVEMGLERQSVRGELVVRNTSTTPVFKTMSVRGNGQKSERFLRREGGQWVPMRTLSAGTDSLGKPRIVLYLGKWLEPGESMPMKLVFSASHESLQAVPKMTDWNQYRWSINTGEVSDKDIQMEVHLAGGVELREATPVPMQRRHLDGSASLYWTHRGACFEATGAYRYQEPEAAHKRLQKWAISPPSR
jgi:hypothetical protein